MSLDLNRVIGLLHIVEQTAKHPAKLQPLGQLAMRELEQHADEAKKDHDKILLDEAKKREAEKVEANKKAAKAAEEEAKKAELTSKPQEVKPVARPATDFKPETSDDDYTDVAGPVRRREVPEEVNHGA